MEKKKIAIVTIVVFVVGLIITGASYAFWSWSSNINKNVIFNVASNLRNYIVYNEGESAFTGELQASNNYQTNSIHSTISIYKTTNVNLLATIHMDINQIGSNMRQSRALKWIVTEGTTSNVGSVLAKGNFIGTNNGDVLTLVPDINVTTTETFYTIWIWLDSSENPSSDLAGETLDANVWTEINQTEGSEDRYEITNSNVNYQQISATVVDSKAKVTKYAVTQSSSTPSSWTTITPATDQANVYTLNTSVAGTGTYYVWFKDENDRVTKKQVTVSSVDTTAPSCNWGAFTPVKIANGETSSVTLTCTDAESGISVHNLNTTDFTPQNNRITITNVEKSAVTNGYQYTITVTGTENDGTSYITLAADKVRNGVNLANTSTSSGNVTVENIIGVSDAVVTLEYTSTTYNGSAKTPSVTVTKNGVTLTLNTDYTVAYANNTNVGTATVTITGIGNYGGETTRNFTIAYNSFNITLDNANATTNGTSTLYMRYADGVYLDSNYTNKMTTSANPITIPVRTGYSFTGYYDNTTQLIDSTGKITSAFTNTKYSGAKTLHAEWHDVEAPELLVSVSVTNGTINALATATDAGEGLDGTYYWKVSTSNSCDENTNGFDTTNVNTYSYAITQSDIYYVCAKVVDNANNAAYAVSEGVSDILVTFNSNGGSTPNPTSKYVVNNQAYGTLPTVTLTGYTFGGWGLIPNEYQEVEYIESNGSQYIDTLYYPTPNTGIYVDFQYTNVIVQKRVFGTDGDSASNALSYAFYVNGNSQWAYAFKNGSGNWISTNVASDTNRHTLSFNVTNNLIQIDNGNTYSATLSGSPTNTSDYTLSILARNNMGTHEGYASLRLYEFIIYESGSIVKHFLPCYRISDSEPGLYDIINGQFYENNDSGDFTVGNEVSLFDSEIVNSATLVTKNTNHTLTAKWVDETPPTGTITLTDDNWIISATINASDAGTGVRANYGWTMIDTNSCDSNVTGFVETSTNTYTFADSVKYYICVRIQDNAGNYNYISERIPASYYLYTGNVQSFTASQEGYYKVETYGAQGGSVLINGATGEAGGRGGYSSGYIYLFENDELYVYVGGKGGDGITAKTTALAGWNGGGTGDHDNNDDEVSGGGGGATDIRYFGNTTPSSSDLVWNSAVGLNSRIMVAGGGGGGADVKSGLPGGNLVNRNTNSQAFVSTLYSASGQTMGYAFGIGQNGARAATNYPPSGGGGGYYGGISPTSSSNYHLIAGGGSSFISGYAGVNAIASANDTANPRTHTNNTIHYSNKYFINGEMHAGVNSGNGKAKITYIGDAPAKTNDDLNDVRYIKDCATGNSVDNYVPWREIQAIKDGVNVAYGKSIINPTETYNPNRLPYTSITDGMIYTDDWSVANLADGNLKCVTVDLGDTYDLDEVSIWHIGTDSTTFAGTTVYNNVTYTSSDNSTWEIIIRNTDTETSEGKRINAWQGGADTIKPIHIYYNGNGGTISGTCAVGNGPDGTCASDGNNFASVNNVRAYQICEYGSTCNLWNYNNSSYLNITRSGYYVTSGQEWNTQANGSGTTFNHGTNYTYAQIAAAATERDDYYEVNVYVKWIHDTTPPTISISPNGGTSSSRYDVTITVSDPSGLNSSSLKWHLLFSSGSSCGYQNYSYTAGETISFWTRTNGVGNCYLHIEACDTAGNCRSKSAGTDFVSNRFYMKAQS